MNFSALKVLFLSLLISLKLGAKALYSNFTSLNFEGNNAIDIAPLTVFLFNMLKLAVLIKLY